MAKNIFTGFINNMVREYYLISKDLGQQYSKYKGSAIRLSHECPSFVDEVVVGIKGKRGKERKITTFRDTGGNILERVFDYFDKPLRNQVHAKRDFVKGNSLHITTDSVTEYSLLRNVLNFYKSQIKGFEIHKIPLAIWDKIKIENNHFCENIDTGEKVLSRTSVTNMRQPKRQVHSFIEFPHIFRGKQQNNSKKILQFRVNSQKGLITDVLTQKGVKEPEQDSFLVFRALDIEEMKTAITKYFIKKRGLSRMNVYIEPEFQPKGKYIERLTAQFDSGSGCINFNKHFKHKSKPRLVSTCRHEVEHAWQYYLDARNTGGSYIWDVDMFDKFGPIRNKELKKEADKYTESIENYVPYYKDYEKYKQNYIEIKADEAGLKARNDYEEQAQEIREAFPFIPKEML